MSDCPRAVSMSFSEADCLKDIVSEVLSSDYSGWVALLSGPWYMSVSAILSENVPCQRLTGQVSLEWKRLKAFDQVSKILLDLLVFFVVVSPKGRS